MAQQQPPADQSRIQIQETGTILPFEPVTNTALAIDPPTVLQSIYHIRQDTPHPIRIATDILNFVNGTVRVFTQEPRVIRTTSRASPANDEERSVKIQRSTYRAFWALCHSIKPITDINSEYYRRRWRAAHASDPQFVLSQEVLEKTYLEVSGLSTCQHLNLPSFPALFTAMVESQDRLRKAVAGQLLLLCSGYGMSYVGFIESFVASKMCVGIAAPTVCSEAVRFMRHVKTLKTQHPDDFNYLGITNPGKLEPLHTRNFPDLYRLAVLWSKEQGLLKANYKMSEHPGILSIGQLRRLARRNVSQKVGLVTDQTQAWLTELGYAESDVKTLKDRLGAPDKKRRRRREEDENSSDASCADD